MILLHSICLMKLMQLWIPSIGLLLEVSTHFHDLNLNASHYFAILINPIHSCELDSHFKDMIRRLADMANTQFITTTFRAELVKVADKIYGVTHKNRVSHVNVVSKDEALNFIEHDQTHNE